MLGKSITVPSFTYDFLPSLYRKITSVGESQHLFGVVHRCLSAAELSAVNVLLSQINSLPIQANQPVKVASRFLMADGMTYFSTAYRRVRVRNSYTVELYSGGFGQICGFVAIDRLDCVLVRLSQTSTIEYDSLSSLSRPRIIPVTSGAMMCVKAEVLKAKCVFVHGSTASYVVCFPNSLIYD